MGRYHHHFSDISTCTLNNSPLTLSEGVSKSDTPARAEFQSRWKLSSDKLTLVIRSRPVGNENGAAFLVVPCRHCVEGTVELLPITSHGTVIPVWRQDIIVAIDGSKLIGYTSGS